MSAPKTPENSGPTFSNKPSSAEEAGSPKGHITPSGFVSRHSPDVAVLQGTRRIMVEAKKLGLDLPTTQAEIATGLAYILDAGKEDAAAAIDKIKHRITQVGEETVQGVVLAGTLDAFEELGGFEELFEYSIPFLEGQHKHYITQVKVLPKLSHDEGTDFVSGATWGKLRIA